MIRCISYFQKPCVSKMPGFRVKDTFRYLCYPVLCGHCLLSCQAHHQAPGLLVVNMGPYENQIIKRYSSLKSFLNPFKHFLNILLSGLHKKCGFGFLKF